MLIIKFLATPYQCRRDYRLAADVDWPPAGIIKSAAVDWPSACFIFTSRSHLAAAYWPLASRPPPRQYNFSHTAGQRAAHAIVAPCSCHAPASKAAADKMGGGEACRHARWLARRRMPRRSIAYQARRICWLATPIKHFLRKISIRYAAATGAAMMRWRDDIIARRRRCAMLAIAPRCHHRAGMTSDGAVPV